jgi:uncharacterized protein (DUF2384 family)
VTPDLMERLDRALEQTDLDKVQAARVLGSSPRTVSRWLQREVSPRSEARERLLEFLAVLEHLSKSLEPQAAHDWLFTPNPLLSYDKPADLLHEGRYRDLLGAIDQLAEGVFV